MLPRCSPWPITWCHSREGSSVAPSGSWFNKRRMQMAPFVKLEGFTVVAWMYIMIPLTSDQYKMQSITMMCFLLYHECIEIPHMQGDVGGRDADASMTAFCLIALQESRSICHNTVSVSVCPWETEQFLFISHLMLSKEKKLSQMFSTKPITNGQVMPITASLSCLFGAGSGRQY